MTAQTWSVFYDEILPWVPGCPIVLADAAIRRTTQEFLDRSEVWRSWLTPINSAANTQGYTLVSGVSNVDIAKIIEIRWNGKTLERKAVHELDAIYPDTDWRVQ
jgi:hypothetical protein